MSDFSLDRHFLKDAEDVINGVGDKVRSFSGQKILITGGAGFLGAHFTYFFMRLNELRLLDKQCHITVLDNFLRGKPNWISEINDRRDVDIIDADICRFGEAESQSYDYIIHAASIASPTYYRKYPIETMDANVIGLRNLLEMASKTPLKSFLYFSSSEIYGDPHQKDIPTSETYRGNVSCTGPRACYDESKRYGETLCVSFWKERQVPVKIARPFNNYGPGLKITDRRVIPDFFRDLFESGSIVMLSDGLATRTFCYISDAITGYLLLLLSDENGESFNIGVDNPEISMISLAELIFDVVQSKKNILFKKSDDLNYLVDNPSRRCPNIEKARSRLGFAPKISLKDGLIRTYNYYIDHPIAIDA
jgi:dTDP-glucose 4,6-dehydratase/UDP-glucuronate decarboxylase